jgi:hypothetical protein
MNTTKTRWALASGQGLAFLVVGLLLAGCATQKTGYQQADRTSKRVADFSDQVLEMRVAVDEVTRTLAGLVEAPAAEPRKAFRQFTRAVDRLEAADAKANRRADQMRAEGREFFSGWEQEVQSIQNDELRAAAQERRAHLDGEFRSISRVIVELRDVFRPWVKDVNDLRTVLGRDLTVSGIDRARGVISGVQDDSAGVQRALNNLISQVELVQAKLTSGRQ